MRRVVLSDADCGRVVGALDAIRQHWLAEGRKATIGSTEYVHAQTRASSVHELMVKMQAAETF